MWDNNGGDFLERENRSQEHIIVGTWKAFQMFIYLRTVQQPQYTENTLPLQTQVLTYLIMQKNNSKTYSSITFSTDMVDLLWFKP